MSLDEELLSMVVHELRTPLTVLKGYLQLARRRLRAPGAAVDLQDVAAMLKAADQNADQVARLVADLLDVTLMSSGKFSLDVAPCALGGLVQEVVRELSQLFPQRAISLRPCGPVRVLADALRVKQVVVNYLTNAIKYATAEAPIQVGVEQEERQVRVSVRDGGPGLSQADQERIWDRFYRGEGVAHQDGSRVGLGLGLYLSRTIVEQHGGQVGVASAPGSGTTFWFTVPLAQAAAGRALEGASLPERSRDEGG